MSTTTTQPLAAEASAKPLNQGLLTPFRLAVLVVLAHVPMLIVFGHQLWLKPHYQFFPVLVGAAAWLAWSRYHELSDPLARSGSALGGGLLIVSMLLLIASTLLFSPWIAAISFVISLVGLSWWLGGGRLLRGMAGPIILLLTVIPPPNGLDMVAVKKMQSLAVNSASRVLDKQGITHLVAGNVLELPSKKLLVEEACSGINSLLSVTAFTLGFAIWMRRGAIHTVILMAFGMFFVLALNIVRITLGAYLEHMYRYDILTGWRHETIGLVLFAICLALVFSLDQLLQFPKDAFRAWKSGLLFGLPLEATLEAEGLTAREQAALRSGRIQEQPDPVAVTAAAVTAPRPRPWRGTRLAWVTAAGFALLLAIDGSLVGWTYARRAMTGDARKMYENLLEPSEFDLPAELAGWTKVEGEEAIPVERSQTIGQFSKTWHFVKGRLHAAIAIDFPFASWHELSSCYKTQGWTLQSRQARDEATMKYVEISMKSALAIRGNLLWGVTRYDGEWVAPEERNIAPVVVNEDSGPIRTVLERIAKSFEEGFRPDFDTYEVGKPAHYQIQAFLPTFGYGELTPTEHKAFYDLYRAGARSLSAQIVKSPQPVTTSNP